MRLSDLETLIEAKTAPLYHATNMSNAVEILTTNHLEARTAQYIDNKKVWGSSFTRDKYFSQNFINVANSSRIIFVMNQQKLSHNHKLIPIDFFSTHVHQKDEMPSDKRRQKEYSESEEFLIGDLNNFDKYLDKIILPRQTYEFMEDVLEHPNRPHARAIGKDYLYIIKHPKTVLEK